MFQSLVNKQTNILNKLYFRIATSSLQSNKRCASSSDICDAGESSKRSKCDFKMDDDHLEAYTDGACENNGRANAKAGIGVWFGDGHPL